MATPRSHRLAGPIIVTNIVIVLFTVPALETWYVKAVDISQVGSVGNKVSIGVGTPITSSNRLLSDEIAGPPGANTAGSHRLTPGWVFEAGETCEAVATLVTGATVVVALHGMKFSVA